ncbi:hypothetical protein [Streptomyces botrytidirepellens]|uniref:Uncharacterized protein n=1 Tax=Streptomyces botrytidirepellens TaxID=2486417 RepID=A0A3M8VM64_9ACTN|nr:hypothetical protein [Streptomyces botrytidirepellens]RNG17889.1 hypothetical protein EEJ42_29065 [Streptomyces botrytidirepellens]
MDIEWGTLGGVFGVSLGTTVVVVVMFSLGIAAWARAAGEPHRGRALPGRGREKWAVAVAAVCFAACLAVAGYGIDLIIPG